MKATWEMDRRGLARVVAEHKGWAVRSGGWIHSRDGLALVQGWDGLAAILEARGAIVVGRGVCWQTVRGVGAQTVRRAALAGIRAARASTRGGR